MCQTSFDIEAEWEGQEAECPHCGSNFIIPKRLRLKSKQHTETGAAPESTATDASSAVHIVDSAETSRQKAREALINKMKAEELAFDDPENLTMHVEALLVPAWLYTMNVHCSWAGQNSVDQVLKSPFEVVKTWQACNGSHQFDFELCLPALEDITQHEAEHVFRGLRHQTQANGYHKQNRQLDSKQSWAHHKGQSIVENAGMKASQRVATEVFRAVSSVTNLQSTPLDIPCVRICYDANGSNHRHFFNVVSGALSGDCPIDIETLSRRLRDAKSRSSSASTFRWTTGLACLLTIAIGPNLSGDPLPALAIGFLLLLIWLIGGAHLGFPFHKEVRKHRRALMRIFADPPQAIASFMYADMNEQSKNRNIASARRSLMGHKMTSHAENALERCAEVLATHYAK